MTHQPTSPQPHEDLLVAYALGVLSADEMQQLSALLRERPELRRELAELREVADALPYALPAAAPPADLRARIVARAAGGEAPAAPAPAAERRPWWQRPWVAALSSGLAALLLALTLLLQSQVSGQQATIQQLQAQLGQMEGVSTERQELIALLANPDIQVDIGSGPGGNLTLVRSSQGDAVVAALPPLQQGRTYQLWLIKEGVPAPASAGTFGVDAQGRGLLFISGAPVAPAEAQVFAVTDEPQGGSPAPTTPILASGETES